MQAQFLLIVAVIAVGVFHTLVPDHWLPITLLARQHGWNRATVARTAAVAGVGHTASTLALGVVVWFFGVLLAQRFGQITNIVSSAALIAFGAWIAIASLREMQSGHDHGHDHFGHAHRHRHDDGTEHQHWHDHHDVDWHAADGSAAILHAHAHKTSSRSALLLILGSSPMIEGIPAFFAASRYGVEQVVIMSVVFALATIGTYVGVCVLASTGMDRLNLGPLERYGEVLSGVLIALVGLAFLFLPAGT